MLEQITKITVSGQVTVARRFLNGAGFWECRKAWRHSNLGRLRQRVGATLASYGGHCPKPRHLGGDFYYAGTASQDTSFASGKGLPTESRPGRDSENVERRGDNFGRCWQGVGAALASYEGHWVFADVYRNHYETI